MKFEGIYPPIITPHHADHSIDRDGFVTMIDYLIAAGVHGVIVGGTTGEYYVQTKDERIDLMKLAKETIKGRVPLIVGAGAIRTEDCIEYGLAARETGADAILVNAPYYAVPTQAELADHALAIDRAVGLPILLYNYPGRTGTMMTTEFLDRLGGSANFAAIKESSGDINQLHKLALGYPRMTLLCGMDDQALEFFAWGARGWVCGAGNCLPEEHLALYQSCVVESDFRKGRRIMSALFPLMEMLEQGGKFVQCIKYGCELAGLPAGPVRKPLTELTETQKRDFEEVVQTLKHTIAQIGENGIDKESGEVVALNA